MTMKKLLLGIAAFLLASLPAQAAPTNSPVIFSGQFAKFLVPYLNLKDNVYIVTGTADPTVTPVSAPRGSIYLRYGPSGGQLYSKGDNGSSTNWVSSSTNPDTVLGPGTTVNDNYLVRWDGTTGTRVQSSVASLSDAGLLTTADLILSGLTATTVPYLNSSKQFTSSAVTPTELGFSSGVTSSLCGINQSCTVTNKTLAVGSNSITSTANRAAQFNSSTGVLEPSSTIDTTELGYLNSVTSPLCGINQICTFQNKTLIQPVIASISNTGTITLPTSTDTLVGRATSDTLTNKTIDADANTLSNIEDADIKVGAAISRAKLASGSANHVLINDGSGVMSSAASLSVSKGGTGAQTATAAFDGLAPTTTRGDLIYHNGTNNARLAKGTSGQWLKQGTNDPAWTSFTAPTIQKFTSGSGTYTTPAGVLYLHIQMVGGGGGGGGSGSTSGTAGTNGGDTTFGTSLLTASGGVKGVWGASPGGAGGAASLGSGPIGFAVAGGTGQGGAKNGGTVSNASAGLMGGQGGASFFSGGGAGGSGDTVGSGPSAGNSPATNSGAGGGGAAGAQQNSNWSGVGGGAGGFVDAIITSPIASYSYAVGAAGTGQGAGTSGAAGGDGAAGVIIVREYYQ